MFHSRNLHKCKGSSKNFALGVSFLIFYIVKAKKNLKRHCNITSKRFGAIIFFHSVLPFISLPYNMLQHLYGWQVGFLRFFQKTIMFPRKIATHLDKKGILPFVIDQFPDATVQRVKEHSTAQSNHP